jgi:vitamin B12 transporter
LWRPWAYARMASTCVIDDFFPESTSPTFRHAGTRGALEFCLFNFSLPGARARRTCATVLTLAAATAYAQTDVSKQSIPRIIVTATRVPVDFAAQSRDVSVLTEADIAASGAGSIAELLARVTGVEISTNGGPGSTAGIFLRGANSGHTLVLVDGQRLTSATAGRTAIEALALGSIERIEIVRGPASALYGADALGGVIQIFTKQQTGVSVALGGGTQRTLRTDAQAGVVQGAWSANVGVSHAQSDGFNAITNPKNFSYNPDHDGFRSSSANANVRYAISPDFKAFARVVATNLKAQYDGSATFDDLSVTKQTAWQLGLESNRTLIRVGESEDNSRFESEFPGFYRTRTFEASAQHSVKLNAQWDALAALEFRRERLSSSDNFEKSSRRTVGALASLAGTVGTLGVNATLRFDDSDQFGSRPTGTAGVSYRIAPQVQLIANVGTAFKAPTFNDLYYPGFSNPKLKSERAVSADFGLRLNFDDANFSAIAYSSRVKDLIAFQCDADFNCAPQNVNRAKLEGLSLSAFVPVAKNTSLRASLDAQSPKNAETGERLPRRATLHGSMGVAQTIAAFTLRTDVIASDARYDDAANTQRMGGYTVLNLGADWRMRADLTLEARLSNVNNARYALAKDFANPGREAFLGLRWTLR